MTTSQFLNKAPKTQAIQKTITTMAGKLDFDGVCLVSVSGGSDSDIMIDLIEKSEKRCEVRYVFFDTGIEYQATKVHLDDLCEKYGIEIEHMKASTPVPAGMKRYGYPFLSKQYSAYIGRLQRHGFDFSIDRSFDEDMQLYPKCKVGLRFWHNDWGDKSKFNIAHVKGLKEFVHSHPPQMAISEGCCEGAKKRTAGAADRKYKPDLKIIGVRREEGGVRATAYNSCFSPATHDSAAEYRPLWYWTDEDKQAYKEAFGVRYSDCYEVYGLKRTGCAGCPFSSRWEEELEICKEYEPKLYKALLGTFGPAYEYAKAFKDFKRGDPNA